jgi:hypothetical protein
MAGNGRIVCVRERRFFANFTLGFVGGRGVNKRICAVSFLCYIENVEKTINQ